MTVRSETNGGAGIDPPAGTAVVAHDWDADVSLALTIVETIARLSGQPPERLERLYDHIDPDSLESLFAPATEGSNRNTGRVTFQLDVYTVTVHAAGTVVVTDSN